VNVVCSCFTNVVQNTLDERPLDIARAVHVEADYARSGWVSVRY
jgi:hypothetical protein